MWILIKNWTLRKERNKGETVLGQREKEGRERERDRKREREREKMRDRERAGWAGILIKD